jgi:hypothetical protein
MNNKRNLVTYFLIIMSIMLLNTINVIAKKPEATNTYSKNITRATR